MVLNSQQFDAFWRCTPDVFIEFGEELQWLTINPAGAALFRQAEAIAIGQPLEVLIQQRLIVGPEIMLAWELVKQAQVACASGQVQRSVHDVYDPVGHQEAITATRYEFVYTPVLDTPGQVVQILAVGRQIADSDRSPGPPSASQLPTPEPAVAMPMGRDLEAGGGAAIAEFCAYILNQLPQGVFWKDINSVYQWCNQSWAEMVGLDSPEEIIGKTELDLSWEPQEARAYQEADLALIAAAEPQLEILTSRQWQTGEQCWFNTNKLPMHNHQGQVVGLLCTFEAITEQRRAMELKESEALLQLVLDNIPQALFWKDRSCTYLGCNRNWAKTAGLADPEAVVGKRDGDIWSPEEAALYQEQDELVMANGMSVRHLIEQQQQAGGKVSWIDINRIPIRDGEGNVIGLLGTLEDITDRKQSEVALRASEAQLRQQTEQLQQTLLELRQTQLQLIQTEKMSSLGQLVAGVAHEINNPVNFIHGNINYAQNYAEDLMRVIELYQKHYPHPVAEIANELATIEFDFIKQDLEMVLRSMRMGTTRIRKIVQSLRNFSRLDESEVKDVDIHDGLESTLTILQGQLKSKASLPDIQVVRRYGDIPLVNCYAGQLNQVFMNILVNAIDALHDQEEKRSLAANQADPSTITITTEHQAMLGSIVIRIRDNGPGMAPKVRERIFDPFFTTKAIGKGTGLGLSISYQVVIEKHGGHLTCTSEPGQGTEFCIEIPVSRPKS